MELKTKGSGGVCDRGGEVIFCSAVSFQKGLAGQSRCATGREEDNREIAASGGGWKGRVGVGGTTDEALSLGIM